MTLAIRTLLFLLLLAGAAFAQQRIDAPSAQARMNAGELVLVDVRTPGEWRSTGIATGAFPVEMNAPDFDERMRALAAANPGKVFAFICAAGGRSASMQRRFARLGLADSFDVAEGMMGTLLQPGWIARGLPVTPYAQ